MPLDPLLTVPGWEVRVRKTEWSLPSIDVTLPGTDGTVTGVAPPIPAYRGTLGGGEPIGTSKSMPPLVEPDYTAIESGAQQSIDTLGQVSVTLDPSPVGTAPAMPPTWIQDDAYNWRIVDRGGTGIRIGPLQVVANNPAGYRTGETVTLTVSAPSADPAIDLLTFSWDQAPAGSTPSPNIPVAGTVLTFTYNEATDAGFYRARADGSAAGEDADDSPRFSNYQVRTRPYTIGTVTISGGGAYDEGDTITLTASIDGDATDAVYSWSGPGISPTPGNPLIIASAEVANTGTFVCTVTSANSSDSPATGDTDVTVNPVDVDYYLEDSFGNAVLDSSGNLILVTQAP
jgi:hypothetical protein